MCISFALHLEHTVNQLHFTRYFLALVSSTWLSPHSNYIALLLLVPPPYGATCMARQQNRNLKYAWSWTCRPRPAPSRYLYSTLLPLAIAPPSPLMVVLHTYHMKQRSVALLRLVHLLPSVWIAPLKVAQWRGRGRGRCWPGLLGAAPVRACKGRAALGTSQPGSAGVRRGRGISYFPFWFFCRTNCE